MKALTLVFLLIYSTASTQVKFEIREFTGKVNNIQPGWGFALELIELQVEDEIYFFRLHPMYGKQILSQIQKGQTVSLKANVSLARHQNTMKLKEKTVHLPAYFFYSSITEIKIQDTWVQTPGPTRDLTMAGGQPTKIFIEQQVEDDFLIDGIRKGLIFKNGLVSFANYLSLARNPMKNIKPGDIVSFMGYESPVKEGYIFPIENVKTVYSYWELRKMVGTINSYIYKQNYVRIGMTVGGRRLSFPAEKAKEIERFSNGESVTVYYDPLEDPKSNLLPSIHALVQKKDTIWMENRYYGGPDGKHDFKSVQIEGTISKLNRSEKGRIISLILDKNFYVEVDSRMEQQLGNLLKKGSNLKISGEERIKKEGEIYEKEYRIITPKRVVTESGEFILNR